MKGLISIILGFILGSVSGAEVGGRAIVDRIEGDYAVVEFSHGDKIKMLDIPVADINGNVTEGREIPVCNAKGKFYSSSVYTDERGMKDTYYQFKSDDGKVWWVLSTKEIGFIPDTEKNFILYYSDNGTVKGMTVCDCPPEAECECYLYDDIFLGLERCGK